MNEDEVQKIAPSVEQHSPAEALVSDQPVEKLTPKNPFTSVANQGTEASISPAQALPESESGWLVDALTMLETGGPVVVLLLAMSIVALALVLAKLIQFQRARLWQRKVARQALDLWQQGQISEALALADNNANPTSQALARAIRGRQRQLPEAAVREEVLRYGSDALFQLRRGFRPLEVIGSLAPLLGLLGTVMGMITAFQQLEAAGNKVNPAILSGGIWEALLTTAVGLCVAIPVVALLNWLERCVDHLAHEMDNLVTQVFTKDLSAASDASPNSEATPTKQYFASSASSKSNTRARAAV